MLNLMNRSGILNFLRAKILSDGCAVLCIGLQTLHESCSHCKPCASFPASKMSTMMSQMVAQPPCAPCTSLRSSSVRGQQLNVAQRLPRQTLRRVASAAAKKDSTMGKEKVKVDDGKKEKEDKGPFKAPALDPSTPSPIFGGSTGGLLRKAQVRRYLMLSCCQH